MSLILYSYYRSSTAYRARIALNWKNLSYEQIPIHLLEGGGQQHKDSYRQINPAGEVPTLIHDKKIISQSFAIIEYLDEVFPENPLFPKEAFDRAKIRQICENINCGIHPLTNLKVMQYLSNEAYLSSNQTAAWQQNWIHKGLKVLEKQLSETAGTYSYGGIITAADIFIVPQLFSARRFGIDLTDYPILRRVETAALELSAFQKAHPGRQPDAPVDQRL